MSAWRRRADFQCSIIKIMHAAQLKFILHASPRSSVSASLMQYDAPSLVLPQVRGNPHELYVYCHARVRAHGNREYTVDITIANDVAMGTMHALKGELLDDDKKTCFGVDLLVPQVGGGARKTNYDYTRGALPEMIDIICESDCKLLVCAVGVPPQWMVDKLHGAGVLIMNMVCIHPPLFPS